MRFFEALACLFGACLIGQVFMTLGLDAGDGAWLVSPCIVYFFIVVCAAPAWLCTFLPIYLLSNSKSLFWRWFAAPPIGALVGFVSGIIMFTPTRYDFYDFPRQNLAPLVIGFVTFLFGSILIPMRDELSAKKF